MKTDLHVHTRTGSDGALSLEEVIAEAKKSGIDLLSITDHDAIQHQEKAVALAKKAGIDYVTGVELNVTFPWQGKEVALDFLGYGFDYRYELLAAKLEAVRAHRAWRARQIVANLNAEFDKEGKPRFTNDDIDAMQEDIDGVLSRPHIADYLVKKNIVASRKEAFDTYLITCDVPKYPLPLEHASVLVHNAGGILVLAHPNDPNGTSLAKISADLDTQTAVIEEKMLDYIDGIECWHSRADKATSRHYLDFCREHGLITTGGSDCHQKPLLLGTVAVPDDVAAYFRDRLS